MRLTAQTNSGRLDVEVAADAAPGPAFYRIYDAEGASEPRLLVVDDTPSVRDREPNDHFRSPQPLPQLPCVVDGRLDKAGDVDGFSVELREGEWLSAAVDAYTLLSRMDAVLRIVTPSGLACAMNHDGATLDPALQWRAPSAGTYVVQIMGFAYPATSEIRLTGGDSCVYRLHVDRSAARPARCTSCIAESEPNDAAATAPWLEPGQRVSGVIQDPGDVDRVRFLARSNEWFLVNLETAGVGSSLAGSLRIEDAAGQVLARAGDPSPGTDARLEWRAPSNGVYVAASASLFRHDGPDRFYQLALDRIEPDFAVTASASALVLKPGETNGFRCRLARFRGYQAPIDVAFKALPAGVTAPVVRPTADGDFTVQIRVASNALPANGPVTLVATSGSLARPAAFSLVTSTTDNGVPGGFRKLLSDELTTLWITVLETGTPSKAP